MDTSGTKEAFAALNITFVPDGESGEEKDEIDTNFPVPSDIWQSLLLFLALQTQWRMISIGMKGRLFYLGLDYAAATNLMRVMKVKGKKRVMSDIQIMESAALTVLNGGTPDEADRPAWSRA